MDNLTKQKTGNNSDTLTLTPIEIKINHGQLDCSIHCFLTLNFCGRSFTPLYPLSVPCLCISCKPVLLTRFCLIRQGTLLQEFCRNLRFLPLLKEFARNVKNQTTLRSEEHTSELQSRQYLVCRLLLEKKKKKKTNQQTKKNPQRIKKHATTNT